jgi:3'(2'), 5'-bisphosphate nucleotidase
MIDPQAAVSVVERIAQEAGRAILRAYPHNQESPVWLKEDQSPVTEADMAAHRLIMDGLSREFPGVMAISEESVQSPDRGPEVNGNVFFLVDPLDGTKEFLAGNGEFTVNIALIEGSHPILGVIHAPVLDDTYYAWTGGGAYHRAREGGPQRIACVPAHDPPRAVLSRSHLSEDEARFIRENGIQDVHHAGSSLKGCLIARGEADVYFRAGDVMEWDIAAMHCILVEAGGTIRLRSGRKLSYGCPGFRISGGFWACGTSLPAALAGIGENS